MNFLVVAIAAILGVFTGKFVYLMTQKKQVTVSSQVNTKSEREYTTAK